MENQSSRAASIDAYIAGFPPQIQVLLNQLRAAIHAAAPRAQEKISYAMPTFYLHGNLVHFAAYKNHIGFYPAPGGMEKFKDELSGYHTSKGAVQFPIDQPLPLDLVSKIVSYRVSENIAKAALKKKKQKD